MNNKDQLPTETSDKPSWIGRQWDFVEAIDHRSIGQVSTERDAEPLPETLEVYTTTVWKTSKQTEELRSIAIGGPTHNNDSTDLGLAD